VVCGDGTLVDTSTGLMWELKVSNCGLFGNIDCDSYTYLWTATNGDTNPDGTLFTTFLAELNNDSVYSENNDATAVLGSGCLANHCDWRIPNVAELLSIVELSACSAGVCIDPSFNPSGYNTETNVYWTSSTVRGGYNNQAWAVQFSTGAVQVLDKFSDYAYARAVRGGR